MGGKGGKNDWSVGQGKVVDHISVTPTQPYCNNILRRAHSSFDWGNVLSASLSGLAKAVKKVGRSSTKPGKHDEGRRSLLSAQDSGSQSDSGSLSHTSPPQPITPTAQHNDKQSRGALRSRQSGAGDARSGSSSAASAAAPALGRVSFVKNPGLSNIQTPFSSCDSQWQTLERSQHDVNRLESIAGGLVSAKAHPNGDHPQLLSSILQTPRICTNTCSTPAPCLTMQPDSERALPLAISLFQDLTQAPHLQRWTSLRA